MMTKNIFQWRKTDGEKKGRQSGGGKKTFTSASLQQWTSHRTVAAAHRHFIFVLFSCWLPRLLLIKALWRLPQFLVVFFCSSSNDRDIITWANDVEGEPREREEEWIANYGFANIPHYAKLSNLYLLETLETLNHSLLSPLCVRQT